MNQRGVFRVHSGHSFGWIPSAKTLQTLRMLWFSSGFFSGTFLPWHNGPRAWRHCQSYRSWSGISWSKLTRTSHLPGKDRWRNSHVLSHPTWELRRVHHTVPITIPILASRILSSPWCFSLWGTCPTLWPEKEPYHIKNINPNKSPTVMKLFDMQMTIQERWKNNCACDDPEAIGLNLEIMNCNNRRQKLNFTISKACHASHRSPDMARSDCHCPGQAPFKAHRKHNKED